jgi:predicted nucleic acid-binding protein
MSVKYFADTNVLVYAFDNSEPAKQLIAGYYSAKICRMGDRLGRL